MVPLTASTWRKLQAVNWGWGYALPCPGRAVPSRAQRVGILDHIGAAAGGGARGEQHEARGREHAGGKIAAQRQIIRDVLVGGIAQPRQRYMGGEFSSL